MINLKEQFKKIKAFAFDVDGVFTDGRVYLFRDQFVRSVNIKDGYAVQYCVKVGFPVAIISGGKSAEIKKRFSKLGVTDIYLGSADKLDRYEDFRMKYHLEHENILYMGDDIPDHVILEKVGMPACPKDACEEVINISKYISHAKGGEGCVRDVIEQVLKVQGKWMNHEAFTW